MHFYTSAACDGQCSLFASDAFKVSDLVTIRRFVSFEFAHLHMKNADVQARNPFPTQLHAAGGIEGMSGFFQFASN